MVRKNKQVWALAVGALVVGAGVAGCAGPAQEEAPRFQIELPPNAAPAEALKPLAFMAGRWVGVNPNKTVNEEHWTAARGNHMVGTFHQVRRDGKPGFVEVSLITAEPEGVRLRLRHLHGGLEVPETRKELSEFTLDKTAENRAEFVGSGVGAGMRVTYRLAGPDRLEVEVAFPEGSKEKPFTSVYARE